ncbi:MAG: PAS domain S-box protein [Gemmatimonadetes bacterium]|nr:PAS domain S-box protein [Gemmatimonadota bacterium]
MTVAAATGKRMMPWRRPSAPGVVPPIRTLLRWLYIGRLSIASGVFLGAALAWFQADISQLFIASLCITTALVFTAASFWYTHLRAGEVSHTFLYSQAVFDLALVTAFVHISGPFSYFAALYILVITFNTVLMPLANGLLIALLAGILYTADVVIGHPVELSAALFLQVAVYWLVAGATGYLSSRARVAGAAHDTLAAELRRVRLEATDILRNIKTGILTVGGEGNLVYANPTAEAVLGLKAGELRDQPALEWLERIAPVLADAIRRTASEGRRVLRREADVTVAGRTFPIGVSTTAVHVADGHPPSVTAIFKDISDEKRLEALHLRTERLEAVAELAASLAHEIKNPLASIRSAVEQLSRVMPPGADERVLSGLIVRESDRLSRLLTEFLDFSRVRVTSSAPLDLVAVAEAGIRLARQHPDCSAGAAIELAAVERPIAVEGDEDLLHRVVFNLVLNAVQAQPASAHVTVDVGVPDVSLIPAGMAMDSPRILRVRDRGPGVASDILPRLFEPFVTGRPGGTGLGLAIVQRAVRAHGGFIFCDTTRGHGTTFSIFIPARFNAEEVA